MHAGPQFRVRAPRDPAMPRAAWLVERDGAALCCGVTAGDAIELALELARADWMQFNTRPQVSLETEHDLFVPIAEFNERHLTPAPAGNRYEQWRSQWLRSSRAALALAAQGLVKSG